jgi:membrane-bound lytic murein transglycosylase D
MKQKQAIRFMKLLLPLLFMAPGLCAPVSTPGREPVPGAHGGIPERPSVDTIPVSKSRTHTGGTGVMSGMPGDTVPRVDSFPAEGEVDLKIGENLDSMLNLWYVEQALENAVDEYLPGEDTLIPDFPDSVYMQRLAGIPSVIDLTFNRIVKNYIDVYTRKRREQMRVMLGLADYYFPIFEGIFDYYNVPYELKYLSVIESALNPRAVSRAGAVGTWQFMYWTGRHYGLTINSLVDERRDPIAATRAAARYLLDLYGMYGDWTLALAAYNCGPGNVNKAIRRSGGRRNFWDIYYFLPRETRGYVPAFIAATYAMNFYPEHRLSKAPLELPLLTDTIVVHEQVHLEQIAGVMGIPVQQLRDMNPQYRRDIIPATAAQGYAVRIPVEQTTRFIDLQDSIFAYRDSVYFDQGALVATPLRYASNYRVELPSNQYDKLIYKVKAGDNVGYIADWYDVRASDLRYWNNIRRNLIRTGQELVIYKPKGRSAKYRDIDQMSFSEKQQFAGRDVPPVTASSGNTEGGNSPGVPTGGEDENGEYVTYVVKSGDTLWEIARNYPGVTETDIARLNNISIEAKIKPGQIIKIKRKG